jgi:hypothetical protein
MDLRSLEGPRAAGRADGGVPDSRGGQGARFYAGVTVGERAEFAHRTLRQALDAAREGGLNDVGDCLESLLPLVKACITPEFEIWAHQQVDIGCLDSIAEAGL